MKHNLFTPTICSAAAAFLLGTFPLAGAEKTALKEDASKKIEASKEKVKSKFRETADAINKEKVDETIDAIANYLDKDQLKEKVDEVASYFDKEKIKEFIDMAAEYLDKERIKNLIDVVAEQLDREKLKEFIDQIASSIDKEQLKEKFDETVDQIASSLEDFTGAIEKEIKYAGNNQQGIQEFLRNHRWNQLIKDQVSWGPATLSNLKLNGVKKAIVVKPGEQVKGEVVCSLNREECSALGMYHVVVGLKHQQGQASIFNHLGVRAGKETDKFVLTAPKQKGVYQVAFRVVKAAREATALKTWDELEKSGEEGEPAVIGLLIVV